MATMLAPRAAVLLCLLGFLAAACAPAPPGPDPAGPPAATRSASAESQPTPFQPAEATPTPTVLYLWAAPSLPESLRGSLALVTEVEDMAVQFVDSPEEADVRVGPEPEVGLTTWVFALAAPFPTVKDRMDLAELTAAWRGESSEPVLVTASILRIFESILGGPGRALVVEAGTHVDQAWAARPALAIVPFESLSPRWKVLELDGQSPIRRDFDAEAYPLAVTFGLSGDERAVRALQEALHWPASNRDPEKLSVVAVTGVTALTRATAWMMGRRGITEAAALIGDWFQGADLVHVSHEVPFAENCPPPDPSPGLGRFCSQPVNIGLLEAIGVDVVELTGNHVMDWGAAALQHTIGLYTERGWSYFGGGLELEDSFRPAVLEHNGNRIAFVGCNPSGPSYAWATASAPGATPCDKARLFEEVARLKGAGYLTIFTFQWAESYRSWPLPGQLEGFREAVDAGAAIVSGSQAHQAMGFEFYSSGFIHYGPGNLFFDQMDSLETRREFVDRHIFYDGRHISTELLTAMLEEWFQPRPMTDAERAEFLALIFKASGW